MASESRPNVRHEIMRADNGRLACSCEAHRWSKGEKTCKHVRAYRAWTDSCAAVRGVTAGQVLKKQMNQTKNKSPITQPAITRNDGKKSHRRAIALEQDAIL